MTNNPKIPLPAEAIKMSQHPLAQDSKSKQERLDRYLFLRRQVLAEIEQGIRRMMEESGHALFHPELSSQELRDELGSVLDPKQPLRP